MYRFASVTSALVAGLASTGAAQSSRAFPFAVSAQLSYFPLYNEGGTGGGDYNGLGPSLRLAYQPKGDNHAFVEAHVTRASSGRGQYNPRLTSFGGMLGATIGRRTGIVRGLIAAGLSRLHVAVKRDTPCLPPCFSEGGTGFRDANLTTLVAGAGILVTGSALLGIRADLRVHKPLTSNMAVGDSRNTRFEFAFGVLISW
jgi:hypothetical protein